MIWDSDHQYISIVAAIKTLAATRITPDLLYVFDETLYQSWQSFLRPPQYDDELEILA